MLSISKISASKAKTMSRYYGAEAKQLAQEKGISVKEAGRILQKERAMDKSAETGRSVESILGEWRLEDAAEEAAEDYDRTTGYYAVKQNEKHRLLNLVGGESEVATEEELFNIFVGQDASGMSLRDPGKLRIEKLARLADLEVTKDLPESYYSALRAGINPETHEPLNSKAKAFRDEIYAHRESTNPDKDITAIDSTFSAPKTVSLLAATADEEVREKIIDIHVEAIVEAMQYGEEHFVTAKRGAGNDAEYIRAKFIRSTVKVELSSRARDPQLHGHCPTSTAVLGEDGRITSMDLRSWMGGSKHLGTVYRRVLTEKLTREYGIQWEKDPRTGLEEIKGVTRQEIEEFSKRSREMRDSLHAQAEEEAEIVSMVEKNPLQFQEARARVQSDKAEGRDAELAAVLTRYDGIIRDREAGKLNVKRRQEAALTSRDNKAELSEEEQLREWKGNDQLVEVGKRLNKTIEKGRRSDRARNADWGLKKEALFEAFENEYMVNVSTFKEKDLRQFIVENASTEYSLEEQAGLAEEYLNEHAVVVRESEKERVGGWSIAQGQPQHIYTTKEIVQRQERIVEVGEMLNDGKAKGYKPDWKYLAQLAEERGLTDEQKAILEQSAGSSRLAITNGVAGSGKTYTLQPVNNALRQEGYTTIGLATRSETAQGLKEAGADRAYSLEKFLMKEWGGVLHDGKYVRGLPAEEMNLRDNIEQAIRDVKAQMKDQTISSAKGEKKLEQLEAQMDAWVQRRQEENEEWEHYKSLNTQAQLLPDSKLRNNILEKMSEIRERNPNAKIRIEDDARPIHIQLDEAGMVSDRHMDELLAFVAADPRRKLTMVGDSKQLESVEQGTAFDLLSAKVGSTEMSRAYRPNHEWEADLQQRWHSLPSLGDVGENDLVTMSRAREIVSAYDEQGRIEVIGRDAVNDAIAAGELSPDDAMRGATQLAQDKAAEEYLRIRDGGGSGCVLAQSHVEVAAVNDKVQRELIERGEIDTERSADVLVSEDKDIVQKVHAGDMLAIRANQNKQSLLNGQLGKVERVTPLGVYISVPDEHGVAQSRFLDRKTLATKEVASLGYAQTCNSSQGITVDEAVLMIDPTNAHAARETTYVGMSRAKESNNIILVSNDGSSDESVRESLASAMVTRGRGMSPLQELESRKTQKAVDGMRAEFQADGIDLSGEQAERLVEDAALDAASSAEDRYRQSLKERQALGREDIRERKAAERAAKQNQANKGAGRSRTRQRAITI